jgi:hypothetical protein
MPGLCPDAAAMLPEGLPQTAEWIAGGPDCANANMLDFKPTGSED